MIHRNDASQYGRFLTVYPNNQQLVNSCWSSKWASQNQYRSFNCRIELTLGLIHPSFGNHAYSASECRAPLWSCLVIAVFNYSESIFSNRPLHLTKSDALAFQVWPFTLAGSAEPLGRPARIAHSERLIKLLLKFKIRFRHFYFWFLDSNHWKFAFLFNLLFRTESFSGRPQD